MTNRQELVALQQHLEEMGPRSLCAPHWNGPAPALHKIWCSSASPIYSTNLLPSNIFPFTLKLAGAGFCCIGEPKHPKLGFFNLNPVDILDQIVLHCGISLVACVTGNY